MSSTDDIHPDRCLNCGSDLVRAYCPDCGQRRQELQVPVRALAREVAENWSSLDARVMRTVRSFLFRPGFLATEWAAGRRARYASPLKLYLLASLVFFLAVGMSPGDGHELVVGDDPRPAPGAAAEVDADANANADAGAEAEPAAKPGSEDGVVIQQDGAIRGHIRGGGAIGAFLDGRLQEFARMPVGERRVRLKAAFEAWIPRVMFFLVPAGTLILALLWRRGFLALHAVVSLHLHAFAFAIFTAMLALDLVPWLAGRTLHRQLLLATLPVYLVLTLRRVYGQGWRRTIAKAAAGSFLYLVAMGVGFAAVAAAALAFA